MASLTVMGAFVLGYALGSIPFGLIVTGIAGVADPRTIGSRNIGATNVLRTGRKDLAVATLLLDMLKGTGAVLIVLSLGLVPMLAAAVGSFIGHIFPVWLRFRGGKGVATYVGVCLGVDWRVAVMFGIVWLGVAVATRYSSAAAIVAGLAAPLAFATLGRWTEAGVFLAMTALLLYKHRENLARLFAGTEHKIGSAAR